MKLNRQPALWFGLALGVAGLVFAGTEVMAPSPATALAGEIKSEAPKVFVDTSSLKVAPNFEMESLTDGNKTLDDYAGKVVILDFWATWCGPCRQEIPHFIRLYDEYREQGLEIVGVSLDRGGRKDVAPFAKAKKINYPLLLNGDKTARKYGGVRGIPTAFVLTQDGKIYKKYVGYRRKEVFESDIRALLGMDPKPPATNREG